MKTQRIDKRKALLFVPLLILPFFAIAFGLMGGGTGNLNSVMTKGINSQLPDAKFKKEMPITKMSVYNQTKDESSGYDHGFDAVTSKLEMPLVEDSRTTEINEKLAAINKEINTPISPKGYLEQPTASGYSSPSTSADVAKLEMLMKNMKTDQAEDPEMKQLAGILKSIQEIQHPELIKEKNNQSLTEQPDSLFKAIPATIAKDQKVVQGAVVEIILSDTIIVNDQKIPKGYSIFGLAEFSNQRLNLQIKNIRLGTSVIPVNITVFDRRDAMSGIYAPEASLIDAVNRGSSDAISGVNLMGSDQGVTTQLAGAGIDAAKGLFNKKIKRVKQKVKAGYPLLLRDNTKKNKY
ncbi:conjugative transposon protein TraM [Pedobacter sp. MC2016-15]|uniref:conjugative transposon protein TraM n=1 Tax=Pedobacter sp. MC2016-15 TaxID=2994473 RepID=UPI0022476817|nr:conjugative transposon protein TraM [Pedobacter sp. MC2016-15]MCX2479353.1 conjugative transposon protein TraM [Pedobacter sp. MC2016-15]